MEKQKKNSRREHVDGTLTDKGKGEYGYTRGHCKARPQRPKRGRRGWTGRRSRDPSWSPVSFGKPFWNLFSSHNRDTDVHFIFIFSATHTHYLHSPVRTGSFIINF